MFTNLGSGIIISDIESKYTQKVYAIDIVQKILQAHPDARLYFLMGDDQIEKFHLWRDFKKLLSLSSFIVVKRVHSSKSKALGILESKLTQLQLPYRLSENSIQFTETKNEILFLNNTIIDISSSDIRENGYDLQNVSPEVMKLLEDINESH